MDRSTRTLSALAVSAAALLAAFVVAPARLAALGSGSDLIGDRQLTDAFRQAFIRYWESGDRSLTPGLARVVDYWLRYHVAKGAIAALLLIVFVTLGVELWKAFLRAAHRRTGLAAAAVGATALAFLSLVTVMANLQGAVAPYASLLPILATWKSDPALGQIRQGLAARPTRAGAQVMLDDYVRYHVAMIVIAALVAALLIAAGVAFWKRSGSADRAAKWIQRSYGVLSGLTAVAAIVVVIANSTTVANPEPGLLALFAGGW
jgi:hypothetical protein